MVNHLQNIAVWEMGLPIVGALGVLPVLSKPALLDSSVGGSIGIFFYSDVSLCGTWELFKHLPGSPAAVFGPKAAQSGPIPNKI